MARFKFTDALKKIFGFGSNKELFYEELFDSLIEGDVGVSTAALIVEKLKQKAKTEKLSNENEIRIALKEILSTMLMKAEINFDSNSLLYILFLGVNGVGKTTSIAKLSYLIKNKYPDKKLLLAAGDTFRAAAIDQIKHHGEKLSIRVIAQAHGADPGAVMYDTLNSAVQENIDIVIADTAGRLHNKVNLMKELEKITKIINARVLADNFKKILVIDATTGQNGFQQAELFNEAVGIDGIIITKYDSTAKGGIIISIASQLHIPILFVGSGEKYQDFEVFNPELFINEFCGL